MSWLLIPSVYVNSVSHQDSDFVFFIYILRVGISGSSNSLIFNFLKNLHPVSKVAIQIYIPNKCTNVHFSLYPYQHLLSHLFDDSHSDRYEVISYFSFYIQFPAGWWCWEPFHIHGHQISSLEKCVYLGYFGHFLS